jgi:GAF domain-containing protein
MNRLKDPRISFALAGALFGLVFPIAATFLDLVWVRRQPLTLVNLLLTQLEQPLIWLIDTAPFVLGILAYGGGLFAQRAARLAEQMRQEAERSQGLGQELERQNQALEERIAERTATLERRALFVEAAAEVGRAATSIYTLDELLPQVCQFVSERFGFYHVGIFLIDDTGEFAVLRASNSEGGRRMIARDHRLRVGEEGIVGYVVERGEARIARDVGVDVVHFTAPELPETRSEMALPLFSGGRLLGALDVQSREAGVFNDDDILALRVLADQVSMAINNAVLFEQLQASVEAERRAYGEVTRQAWRRLLGDRRNWGYRYAEKKVGVVRGAWSPLMLEAAHSGRVLRTQEGDRPALAVPVLVAGESIGVLHLRKGSGEPEWNDEEVALIQALSDQLSQAVNSARLYEETQRRAAQEQLTSEIASNLRQTLDIDAVLRTAVEELGETFAAREVVIRINPEEA